MHMHIIMCMRACSVSLQSDVANYWSGMHNTAYMVFAFSYAVAKVLKGLVVVLRSKWGGFFCEPGNAVRIRRTMICSC